MGLLFQGSRAAAQMQGHVCSIGMLCHVDDTVDDPCSPEKAASVSVLVGQKGS